MVRPNCDDFSLSSRRRSEEGRGEELVFLDFRPMFRTMDSTANARCLRRNETEEEKQLWRALRSGRFVGFKFRRQHPVGKCFLDFYCPTARLSVELDGFQHGLPEQRQRDAELEQWLAAEDIEELRFWNHQWRDNREGVLLEIWPALHRRTGCVQVMRKVQNHRSVPPRIEQLKASARNRPLNMKPQR